MANITVTSTPTNLIGPAADPTRNRKVYVSNLSNAAVWLLFDGSSESQLSSTTPVGFQLNAAGTAGDRQVFGGTSNGDNDGTNAIWAVAAGSALVNVQAIVGRKTIG